MNCLYCEILITIAVIFIVLLNISDLQYFQITISIFAFVISCLNSVFVTVPLLKGKDFQ